LYVQGRGEAPEWPLYVRLDDKMPSEQLWGVEEAVVRLLHVERWEEGCCAFGRTRKGSVVSQRMRRSLGGAVTFT